MMLKIFAILVIVSLIVSLLALYAEAKDNNREMSGFFPVIWVVSSLVLAIMCLMQ